MGSTWVTSGILSKTYFRLSVSFFVCLSICCLPAERLAGDDFHHIRLAFAGDHAPQPNMNNETRKSLITGPFHGGNKFIKAVALNKVGKHRQALRGNVSTPGVRRHRIEQMSLDCRSRSSRIPVPTHPRVCRSLPTCLGLLRLNVWLPVNTKPTRTSQLLQLRGVDDTRFPEMLE